MINYYKKSPPRPIEGNKTIVNGEILYDFTAITIFWITAAVLSIILALFTWKKT